MFHSQHRFNNSVINSKLAPVVQNQPPPKQEWQTTAQMPNFLVRPPREQRESMVPPVPAQIPMPTTARVTPPLAFGTRVDQGQANVAQPSLGILNAPVPRYQAPIRQPKKARVITTRAKVCLACLRSIVIYICTPDLIMHICQPPTSSGYMLSPMPLPKITIAKVSIFFLRQCHDLSELVKIAMVTLSLKTVSANLDVFCMASVLWGTLSD
jgi:hypothetical protein